MAFSLPPPQPKGPNFGSAPGHSSPKSSPSCYSNLMTTVVFGVGLGVGVGMGLKGRALGHHLWKEMRPNNGTGYLLGPMACLSMATSSASADMDGIPSTLEPNTGVPFPSLLGGDKQQQLAGVGVRKKSLLGLKNINVYAFGVYADQKSLKERLSGKYNNLSPDELKNYKAFLDDVIANDLGLTVRLEIVYGKLNIGSVRSAFEESIGSRLKKFSGSNNQELLKRFTSQFKDDYKLPRGTKIHITRLPGHVLQTKIGDTEVGTIQSQLLCQSVFDLYIGEAPLDAQAKEKIGSGLASLLTQ